MVNYHGALIEGRLIRRYKRFFVDIDVGEEIIVGGRQLRAPDRSGRRPVGSGHVGVENVPAVAHTDKPQW